jgi:hypothetical protein
MDTANEPVRIWLGRLVEENAEQLAADLLVAVQRDIPYYKEQPPGLLLERFVILYRSLAETYRATDIKVIRAYLETQISWRMRSGVSGDTFIRAALASHEVVTRLVETAPGVDAAQRAAALRHVQAVNQSARLILSELNLRTLTGDPPPRPDSP